MENYLYQLFHEVCENLDKVNFQSIFPGFHRFPFALYDEKQVLLEDRGLRHSSFTPKDNLLTKNWDSRFLGNTAIECDGLLTAIWNAGIIKDTEIDAKRLTASIVHEMFHCYQKEYQEQYCPDENLGMRFPLSAENLNAKRMEITFLQDMWMDSYPDSLHDFVSIRESRLQNLGEFAQYELALENFEGLAVYVESIAYSQIKECSVYDIASSFLPEDMLDLSYLNRHRITPYHTGFIMAHLLDDVSDNWKYHIMDMPEPLYELFKKAYSLTAEYVETGISNDALEFVEETKDSLKNMFNAFLQKENLMKKKLENCKLTGFDPMNAKNLDNMLYHPHFVKLNCPDNEIFLKGPAITIYKNDIWTVDTVIYLDNDN